MRPSVHPASVRSGILVSWSAPRREGAIIWEVAWVIIVVVVLVGAWRGASGDDSPTDLPWEIALDDVPVESRQSVREAFAALPEIERHLGLQGIPTPITLRDDLVPPFSSAGIRTRFISSSSSSPLSSSPSPFEEGPPVAIAYLLTLAPPTNGEVLIIVQPTTAPVDGVPDAEHHRLRDGRFVHPSVWWSQVSQATTADVDESLFTPLALGFLRVRVGPSPRG